MKFIIKKKGVQNVATDALSRLPSVEVLLLAISVVHVGTGKD